MRVTILSYVIILTKARGAEFSTMTKGRIVA